MSTYLRLLPLSGIEKPLVNFDEKVNQLFFCRAAPATLLSLLNR